MGDTCDLRCTYCYEIHDGKRTTMRRMAPATLERAIAAALDQAHRRLAFLWHGGEPTLAGISFYAAAMEMQKRLNTRGVEITNSIQSHGLRLDDDWIPFILKHQFSIGISLDGTQDLHDLSRVDSKGRPTFERAAKNVRKLIAAGVNVGAIAVISEASIGRENEIMRCFAELGVLGLDLHPRFGELAPAPNHRIPADFAAFMTTFFDLWLHAACPFSVVTFDEALRFFVGAERQVCYFSGRCSSIVAIESNGTVVSCTRPFDLSAYTFGDINRSELKDVAEGRQFQRFADEDRRAIARTMDCPWHDLCGNGCPQHRVRDGLPAVDGNNRH